MKKILMVGFLMVVMVSMSMMVAAVDWRRYTVTEQIISEDAYHCLFGQQVESCWPTYQPTVGDWPCDPASPSCDPNAFVPYYP